MCGISKTYGNPLFSTHLSPVVGKVDDENELDEDEEEAAHHAKVHPHLPEGTVRDPECSNHAADDEQILETPEPVLDACSRNRERKLVETYLGLK